MNLNFNSLEFIFGFLPIFLILYHWIPSAYRNFVLLAGSFLFYGWGNPWHLGLLILSVLINYVMERRIFALREKEKWASARRPAVLMKRRARGWLVTAVIVNLSILASFKYCNMIQPLGISFYTFQILSCLFDTYRGKIQKKPSLLSMSVYICMFPKLGSGPLISYPAMEAQLSHRTTDMAHIEKGLRLFTLGLSSKLLLADNLGILWNDVQIIGFRSITTPLAWLGAMAFSMQLYFDFWGYSMMAVGLGEMLGFSLPDNFHQPYMAKTVSDFYRRWHMTLGQWFRDYVYIPMGGNRKGGAYTCINLLFVWLLTGIWHGNSWNFVLWGVLLGVFIVLEKFLYGKWLAKSHILGHLYIMVLIPVTWMVFAVHDMRELGCYISRMFGIGTVAVSYAKDAVSALQTYGGILILGILFCTPLPGRFYKKVENTAPGIIGLLILFWLCIYRLTSVQSNPFMYLQF